jgi:hypothetical protein
VKADVSQILSFSGNSFVVTTAPIVFFPVERQFSGWQHCEGVRKWIRRTICPLNVFPGNHFDANVVSFKLCK